MSIFSTPFIQASVTSVILHVSAVVGYVSFVSTTSPLGSSFSVKQDIPMEYSLEYFHTNSININKEKMFPKTAPPPKKKLTQKKKTTLKSASQREVPHKQERVIDISSLSMVGAYMPKPIYPKSALRQKKTGLVRLEFSLRKTGHVKKITKIISSGHPDLDQAAKVAVSLWHFPKDISEKHLHLSAPIRFIL